MPLGSVTRACDPRTFCGEATVETGGLPCSSSASGRRALGAVEHSTVSGCWPMLSTGDLYREAGGDYFTRRDPERAARRLVTQLERLGHRVTRRPPLLDPLLCR